MDQPTTDDELPALQRSLASLRAKYRTAKRERSLAPADLHVLRLEISANEAQERLLLARREKRAQALHELMAELAVASGTISFGRSEAAADKLKALGSKQDLSVYLRHEATTQGLGGQTIVREELVWQGVRLEASRPPRAATEEELANEAARQAEAAELKRRVTARASEGLAAQGEHPPAPASSRIEEPRHA